MKKVNVLMVLGLCLASSNLCAESTGQKPEKYNSFRPGELWKDTDGNTIEAHGGGMYYEGGTYYWFGEHGTPGRTKIGVMCYSSKDLYNWKKEGVALPLAYDDPDSDITVGCALERPKVIYNAATKKYVMWFHLELKGQGYDAARSGVAVSDNVIGPYKFLESFRPNNEMARDQTLFVDDDGKAYHFCASEDNRTMQISLLTDDYLKPSGKHKRIFIEKVFEAPTVFKYQGRYYFIGSECSAYAPNSAHSAEAPTIWGAWKELGNPCIGQYANKTFFSQSTYVLPLAGKPGAFIFMADRWVSGEMNGLKKPGARYVWLPITFEKGRPVLKWMDEWDLSVFDSSADNSVTVKHLQCEYNINPLGIDVAKPRLSWVLESGQRGQMQSAYQILVASSEKNLKKNHGDLWDTGKINSDQSIHVVYEGKSLKSRMRCWWKVCVWDKDGKPSSYSRPAWWEMGLSILRSTTKDELEYKDWYAKWVSAPPPKDKSVSYEPSPFFRKAFMLAKPVKKARVYISGLGYYELYLNGKKVGDHVLDPAFTRYDRRVLYVTYDVTDQLVQGKNAVGVVLGNGWYNMHTHSEWDFDKAPWRDRPTMICQLEVEFVDGSSTIITSDSRWKVSTGPIVFESIRNGETYDARLEKPRWNTADYDDSAWATALVVPGPKGKFSAQMLSPIKVMKTIKPVKLTEPKPAVFVFDIGQNIAGWAQLRVSGPVGTRVQMKYAERLYDDGTVSQEGIATFSKQYAFQTDTYILKGQGAEVWEPRFVYHGFQYVEVTGFPGKPTFDSLRGRVAHTAFEQAGRFECSNELFNKIQRNTLWSYIGNFHGYPTDCPHREKNGWTGDAHLAAEQGLYNFAPAAAYTKWMNDFKDEQRQSGELPGIVPTSGWGYHWGNGPAWDSAYVLIPWYLYQYCGDVRILAEHYDRLKRYVDYLTSKASNHVVSIGLGDWVPAKTKTPEKVTSTGYYYCDAVIVSRAAELLGKDEDAKKYADLARDIKEAFNKEFFDDTTGQYAGGTQTALSCALYHGFVEPEERERVVNNLVSNVESQQGHLDAGILGTKYLLNSLTENGRADVAYTIATRTTYPSWGHWIARGATTLWEQWGGEASRNHIMFGDISAWFYKALAGINPDPNVPGFKHIIIHPNPVSDLKWVHAEHSSMYGKIISYWRKKDGGFTLEVTIPANTTATVYVPTMDAASITESGKPVAKSESVKLLPAGKGQAVFAVGSGQYRFVSRLPE